MPPEALAAADLEVCRQLLRRGSKSFAAAARLLPGAVRDQATVVYAFCRVADDRIDTAGTAPQQALGELDRRLTQIYAGQPADDPVDRALAVVVQQARLPSALPRALLEGFAWDAAGRRYQTMDELYGYAARVAGAVGAMMTLLMGTRGETLLARACDLGVAMQLTNIARDVGDDAKLGRLYLPEDWMREAGLDPDDWLARPAFDARLGRVVARVLETAATLYRRADAGIWLLPAGCRTSIRAARLIYADIGRVVAQAGHDSVSRRAVVPWWRKVWLMLRSLRAPRVLGGAADPALPATRFLVRACQEHG